MAIDYMARALRLARQAQGSTGTRPPVGAVLVKDGRIVGEGFTQPGGSTHAEVVALTAAGEAARGATLYTTLEPCSHFGRTLPCANALIAAGVAAVHIGTLDENPAVSGEGMRLLEAASIPTTIAERHHGEADELVDAHVKFIRSGSPFVTAKFAASLDGKIATAAGDSKWITGEASRAYAHRVRASVDAIMVGLNTVLKDDPELTARPGGRTRTRQPLRVVVDSRAQTPVSAKVLDGPGMCAIAIGHDPDKSNIRRLEAKGAVILHCPGTDQRVHLPTLLKHLVERECINLLVEGGGTLLGTFFDLHLVDKVLAFYAPIIIGGADSVPAVGGEGVANVADALRLERTSVRRLGGDMLVKGYVPATRYPSADPSLVGSPGPTGTFRHLIGIRINHVLRHS